MNELPIYNCHIHTFTSRNVPRNLLKIYCGPILGTLLSWLVRLDWMKRLFVHLAHGAYRFIANDTLQRLAAMYSTGNADSQADILHEIQKQYPRGSRFIVLAMNMDYVGLDKVQQSIEQQHADLLKLAQADESVIPFFAVDPRQPDVVEQVRQNVAPGKFRGVKIYPNFGYYPYEKPLMQVYEICVRQNVPVMTHCSTGGMYHYGFKRDDRARYSHPDNYIRILEEFKELRLCLAHYGGSEEWDRHLAGLDDREGPGRAWVKVISALIRSGNYPNLYTDISYLAFQPRPASLHIDYADYLKVLLADPLIREYVLFGSDYYAVKREPMSEKEVSISLRSRLGEDLYFQIAHHNPRRYLGLQAF